jgi:hypothetical protein
MPAIFEGRGFLERRIRKDFPYYGAPYTPGEQVGVKPMPRPVKK